VTTAELEKPTFAAWLLGKMLTARTLLGLQEAGDRILEIQIEGPSNPLLQASLYALIREWEAAWVRLEKLGVVDSHKENEYFQLVLEELRAQSASAKVQALAQSTAELERVVRGG
jgi:hypothetical protein